MKPERIYIMENQERAFLEGIAEKINDDWIIFDNENEEAYPIEDFLYKEVQIKEANHWHTGILLEDGVVQSEQKDHLLQDQENIRIRKTLTLSFQAWLNEIQDEAFYQFINNLNSLGFSVFDMLFCHNFLSFLPTKEKSGVNFFLFDNTEEICSVHHHFQYDENVKNDRFEFTLNTGNRVILQAINPKHLK